MTRRRGPRLDLSTIASLGLIALVMAGAQAVEGARASSLLQPTAALIVMGVAGLPVVWALTELLPLV